MLNETELHDKLKALYIRKAELMRERQSRLKQRQFDLYYPDSGKLSRHNYPKHMEFIRAGAEYNERLFMAGNRLGKTLTGSYEMACHLTGMYPHWWDGALFDEPTDAWAAGKTNETTRNIVQKALFGNVIGTGRNRTVDGTGMIYGSKIIRESITWRSGVQNLIDTCAIEYANGGISTIGLKSYEQGRGSFEGTAKHVVWLDEEPPREIYTECYARTHTVDGVIYLTFTPLEGMTNTVLEFLPNGIEQMKRELGVE